MHLFSYKWHHVFKNLHAQQCFYTCFQNQNKWFLTCNDRFIEFTLCFRIYLMLHEGKLSAYAASVHGKYQILYLLNKTQYLQSHVPSWIHIPSSDSRLLEFLLISIVPPATFIWVLFWTQSWSIAEKTHAKYFHCKVSLHELSIIIRMTLLQWSHVTFMNLYLSLVMSECGPKQRDLTLVS